MENVERYEFFGTDRRDTDRRDTNIQLRLEEQNNTFPTEPPILTPALRNFRTLGKPK